MEIISKIAIDEITKDIRFRKKSVLAENLKKLQVGEGVKILKSEWVHATAPGVYVQNYKLRLGMGFSVRQIPEGWIAIRTK